MLNNTTKLILPLIVKEKYDSSIINDNGIRAYIGDYAKPEYDNTIMVAAKDYVDEKIFTVKSFNKFRNQPTNETVQVFDVPKNKVEDYYKLVTTNLKSVSEDTKDRILSFWSGKPEEELIKTMFENAEADMVLDAEMFDSYGIVDKNEKDVNRQN